MAKTDTNIAWFNELLAEHTPPCISIYQPLHRSAPPAHENPIRFRTLLDRARQQLQKAFPTAQVEPLLARIRFEVDRGDFWTGPRDGMALFASPDYFQIIELQHAVDEHVEVAGSFHVRPLIRLLQSADRYHVLCFAPNSVRLFEGSRTGLRPIELAGVPTSIFGAVGGMSRNQNVSIARDLAAGENYTEDANTGTAPVQIEQFIRAVDQGIWESYSRRERLPVILVADIKYHRMFRDITRNPHLLEQGVRLQPDNLPLERLRDEAWKVFEPQYQQRVTGLIDQFNAARAHNMGSEHLQEVAQAAANGRVSALIVAENAHIPGRLDRTSGQIEAADLSEPDVDDVLDDLAEMVLRMDGQVIAVPPEMMPTDAGLAAIYRY